MNLGSLGSGSLFVLSSFLMAQSGIAAEENSFQYGPFQSFTNSIDKLRDAYRTLQSDRHIRDITRNGESTLDVAQRIEGNEIRTTRFQHYFRGIHVVGSEALHHDGAAGVQVSNYVADFSIDTQPSLSGKEAFDIARAETGLTEQIGSPELKILPDNEGAARLTYWIEMQGTDSLEGASLVIDAHDGRIIANVSSHHTVGLRANLVQVAPINVYQANMGCQILDATGRPSQINVTSCQQTVLNSTPLLTADASARQAFSNSQQTLQYYKTTHNRNSLDGLGMTVAAVVHVGQKFDNAFWDSQKQIMAYGDGDNETFGSFTVALDVAGHEMTHGVVSKTAKLLYFGESGALNEAYADFFGKMIANDGDWAVGRKLFLNQATAKGVRNLQTPGLLTAKFTPPNGIAVARPYPSKMSEEFPIPTNCDRTNDNCWVHVNSTIPGHASYLIVQALGKQKAEKLYYATLTQFLNSNATFSIAAQATKRACAQLYDALTCTKVTNAFASVGL